MRAIRKIVGAGLLDPYLAACVTTMIPAVIFVIAFIASNEVSGPFYRHDWMIYTALAAFLAVAFGLFCFWNWLAEWAAARPYARLALFILPDQRATLVHQHSGGLDTPKRD